MARSRRSSSVGRSATGQQHGKLTEIVRDDFLDYSDIEPQLAGYDACFFCLGVSSVGMDAERYRHLTYDITLAAATTLARLNPQMAFIYVTGAGTDSTEQGRVMWARVKGKTENDLLKLPFSAAYMFRPGCDPAAAWRALEDGLGAGDLCRDRAAAVVARADRAEIRHHHGADGPRHDQGRARRLSEAGAGKRRYQFALGSAFC